jgi:cytochrome c-type biogenesis protein CcmF
MLAGTIGKGIVFAAIAFFAIALLAGIFRREKWSRISFILGVVSIIAAFATHVLLLMKRQYQFAYVWENTSNEMAEVYRFSAAWAAQEGSFLLWTLMSAIMAAVVLRKTGGYSRHFLVVCSIALVGMSAIIAYESPFHLIQLSGADRQLLSAGQEIIMPPEGRGLNPTLMNYWMVIHPWVIFIGFGSLLPLFGFAAAAAIRKDHQAWIDSVRPFAVFSMILLGVGLTMGGLWAYETLGWGGFWAWDPVENVSLVPFVATAVLVHGLLIQKNRKRWARINIVLGLLPFVWFVYGTFLTRSGALTAVSVHSFAEMNQGAHRVLLWLVIATVISAIALSVVAFTSKVEEAHEPPASGQRTLGMSIGLALLYGIGLMAAYGMSLPFFGGLLGRPKQVVSEAAYNFVVAFPFVPTLLLMALVPFLGWTKTAPDRIKTIGNVFFASVLAFGAVTFWLVRSGLTLIGFERMPTGQLIIFYALVFVCLFSIVSNGYRTIERIRSKSGGIGAFVTHAGVALLLLGLIVSRAFEKTDFDGVTPTRPGRLALMPSRTYLASIQRIPTPEQLSDPNNRIEFLLQNVEGKDSRAFRPNFYYMSQGSEMTPISRPDIVRRPLYDLYFVMGAPETELESDITLNKGEEKTVGQFRIKYLESTREGEPGERGTRFGIKLKLNIAGREYDAHPQMMIGESGPEFIAADIEELQVRIELRRLMAETGAATLAIVSPELIFPVQLFYKPLTILVWIGAGLMTLGGSMTIYRLRRRG